MLVELPPLDIKSIQQSYKDGISSPRKLVESIQEAIKSDPEQMGKIWIHVLSIEELEPYLKKLEEVDSASLPLYGVPFAIKDNIDLKGVPTTAACPEYAYIPEVSAHVVDLLIEAGAIPIGKSNMDQFATGLVGVRSPYGTPENAYHPDYIPGGSSSGSAVAVARGLVSFSLGTDTAGSGRVPAAFNNIVGHKPSKGLVSCRGVIPACRSLDCVSIFADSAIDAKAVLNQCIDFDKKDPYSRESQVLGAPLGSSFTFGIPSQEQLDFFGNDEARELFEQSVKKFQALGGVVKEIDFTPFLEAALLLYDGPWVSERYVAIESVLAEKPEILHPVTRSIIESGADLSAADAFKAEYKLRDLKRLADEVFNEVEFILTPTTGTIYTLQELEEEPIQLNSNLGYYTNFMNLLDYAATAFPVGFMDKSHPHLPFGVTAFAPAFQDAMLIDLAARYGGDQTENDTIPKGYNAITVCGAHLEGLPLNWQLTDRGAKLWKVTETAPKYHFYALPPITLDNGTKIPPRPGVLRVAEGGVSIKVEVWLIPTPHFGSFVAHIPAPLVIGKVELIDGSQTPGFICEPYALTDAKNITNLADWRVFVNS